MAVLAIFFFAAVSFYSALVVLSRVDNILLPGNEVVSGVVERLSVPVPGTRLNVQVPLPGVEGDNRPSRPLNILVLGLDRRPDEPQDEPYRSDTIFLVRVDPSEKTATILAFPRDLLVEIPVAQGRIVMDRINSAYPRGEVQGYPGGGPGLLMATIKHNFGIPVDDYVAVDFQGFVRLIDALGGIDIEVTETVMDYVHPDVLLPYGGRLDPGFYHMDGQMALAYSRVRTDSDLKRIKRQQQVIFAALRRARDLNLFNLPKLLDLWDKYHDAIDTDINDVRIPGLALLAIDIGPDRVFAHSLGPATVPWISPVGASMLVADRDKALAILLEVLGEDEEVSLANLPQLQALPPSAVTAGGASGGTSDGQPTPVPASPTPTPTATPSPTPTPTPVSTATPTATVVPSPTPEPSPTPPAVATPIPPSPSPEPTPTDEPGYFDNTSSNTAREPVSSG